MMDIRRNNTNGIPRFDAPARAKKKIQTVLVISALLVIGFAPIAQADGSGGPEIPSPEHPLPVPDVDELEDMVAWTTAYPEKVRVGDLFTLSGGMSNKLDIPLLVTVEIFVNTDEVCSLESFTTQSRATDVRQHEYLLMPEGSSDDDLGGSIPIDDTIPSVYATVFNADTIAYSMDLLGDTPGKCEVSIVASVNTVSGLGLSLDEQHLAMEVEEPLATSIDLGGFDIDCQLGAVLGDEPLLSQTVAAGDVDLKAILGWTNRCRNNDWGVLGVEYRESGEEWEELELGGKISDPGVDTVHERINLDPGEYEFRVTGALMDHWFDWNCILAIAGMGLAGGVLLFSPEPISKGLLIVMVISIVVNGVNSIVQCQDSLGDSDDYKVTVTVKDEDAAAAILDLPGIPHIPGPFDHIPEADELVE